MREWLLISAVTLALLVTGFTAGWLACAWHAERRRFDAQIEAHEKTLAERREPKHARDVRRVESAPAGRDRAVRSVPARERGLPPGVVQVDKMRAGSGLAAAGGKRAPRDVATTADTIGPVVVPEPGVSVPFRPQPAPDPSRDTMTLRRLTDTGEMRAAGDMLIARMREDQAAWEAQFHAECEADRTRRTEELAG